MNRLRTIMAGLAAAASMAPEPTHDQYVYPKRDAKKIRARRKQERQNRKAARRAKR